METIHPSGRVQILDAPVALPGKCTQCGSAKSDDDRKFIDIGFELDYYGVVYFCTFCFSEIAASIGWIAPSLFKDVEEENKILSEKVAKLEAENAKLRTSLSQLDFLGIASVSANIGNSIVEKSETKSESKSGSSKSTNESGRANIRETKSAGKNTGTADEFEEFGI